MKLVVDPPQQIAGVSVRLVCALRVEARRFRFGIAGTGEKLPVALLVGTGHAARLVGLDGIERDPAALLETRDAAR